jgi:hypothetical protein
MTQALNALLSEVIAQTRQGPPLNRPTFRLCRSKKSKAVMAFVQFTQSDDQPVLINTERIVTAVPAPPDGEGTRITFSDGSHQDVKELIADVLRRLNISA